MVKTKTLVLPAIIAASLLGGCASNGGPTGMGGPTVSVNPVSKQYSGNNIGGTSARATLNGELAKFQAVENALIAGNYAPLMDLAKATRGQQARRTAAYHNADLTPVEDAAAGKMNATLKAADYCYNASSHRASLPQGMNAYMGAALTKSAMDMCLGTLSERYTKSKRVGAPGLIQLALNIAQPGAGFIADGIAKVASPHSISLNTANISKADADILRAAQGGGAVMAYKVAEGYLTPNLPTQ